MAPDVFTTAVRPLRETTWRFYALVGALAAVAAWGLFAYVLQLVNGLGVTGLSNGVSWGLYISNFVVFIAISMAGTLISAVLRLSGAEWRRPITRLAEAVTVTALAIAAVLPLVDMGRPDRFLNMILHAHLTSALVWDFLSLSTYIAGSLLFLYLPLIPDLALLRDAKVGGPVRQRIYTFLAMRWHGTPEQQHRLERGLRVMAVLIIPVAVSIHTVTAWIFAVTMRAGWHTALFGPFFVVGALLSGLATLLIIMAAVRRGYGLERFLRVSHFRSLAVLMLVLDAVLLYLTLNEVLIASYGGDAAEARWIGSLLGARYGWLFWGMIVGGFLLPPILIGVTRARSVAWIVAAAVLVDLGMWIERVLIVVPVMASPQMPTDWATYTPTWVEWSISAGAFAGFALAFVAFTKLFPIVSVWEMSEAEDEPVAFAVEPKRAAPTGRVVAGVLIVLVLLVAGFAHRAGAEDVAAVHRSTLTLAPLSQGAVDLNSTLVASLVDGGTGRPVAGAELNFSVETTFGWLPLGSNRTDERGTATFAFRPHGPGTFTLGVQYRGDGTYGPATALGTLTVSAPPQARASLLDAIGGVGPVVVVATVGAVWSSYAFVGWQVVAIWRGGKTRLPRR